MGAGSFIVCVKTDDICKDITEDFGTRFDTSNFELHRLLPKGKNKKAIGLIKEELGRQIMKEIFELGTKTYSYLKDNNDEDKKAGSTKMCAIKKP